MICAAASLNRDASLARHPGITIQARSGAAFFGLPGPRPFLRSLAHKANDVVGHVARSVALILAIAPPSPRPRRRSPTCPGRCTRRADKPTCSTAMTGCEVLARTCARIASRPSPPRPKCRKGLLMPGDQFTPVMIFRLGPRSGAETIAMNTEGELDHPRNAVRFAERSIVGEGLRIAARCLHEAIEVLLADDAELGGLYRLAVLLERRQQLRDVGVVGLMQSEKTYAARRAKRRFQPTPPSASRLTTCRETR